MQNIKTNCPKNSLAKTIRWLFFPNAGAFPAFIYITGKLFQLFRRRWLLSHFLSFRFRIFGLLLNLAFKMQNPPKKILKKGKTFIFSPMLIKLVSGKFVRTTHKKLNKSESWISEKKTSSFSNDKTNVNVVWSRGKKSIATEKLQITNLLLSRSLSKVLSPWQPRKMRPGKSSDCTLIDSCWFRRWRGKMQKSKLSATGRRRKPRKPMEKFAVREKKWLSENRQTEADIENTPLVLDPESDDKFS